MTDREKWIRLANDWYDEAFKASRKQTIDEVLEIIDWRIEYNNPVSTLLQARAVSELNHVKHDILALKGGEQK